MVCCDFGRSGWEEVRCRIRDLMEHLNMAYYGNLFYLVTVEHNYEECLERLEAFVYTVHAVFVEPYVMECYMNSVGFEIDYGFETVCDFVLRSFERAFEWRRTRVP